MESNYVSAVIYFDEDACAYADNARRVAEELRAKFTTYEIIIVDDGCDDACIRYATDTLAGHPFCVLRMGNAQGIEAAMNAGVDSAVGDYVYEIDDLGSFDPNFIVEAYDEVMTGSDIVNGVFAAGSSGRGKLFYGWFNRFSGFPSKLASNSGRLLSRRAINRVRSMSAFAPYRKASYAASGLKVAEIGTDGKPKRHTDPGMAAMSLALYTDAFYKVACGFVVLMVLLSAAELAYVVSIAIMGIAVTGWVTIMLVLTVGLLAIFVLLAFVLKYLDILVRITFERQPYLTDGIERPDNNR